MITNIIIALFPPVAAYIWTQIFLFAGGDNFQDSFYYSLAALSIILIPVGLYYGRITITVAGIFWLFVMWNVVYEPFAVLF
jgi:Na+-driven multidrug efflux pump